jgi:acetyl esterase/lipase
VTTDGSDGDSGGGDGSSVATKWMANEKRLEEEMDTTQTAVDSKSNNINTADNNNNNNNSSSKDNEEGPHTVGRWEELHGNYILRPPQQQPRALLHFLGGALVGASPQLTYRYLLERLSSNGYLIVATPYQLSFDHLTTCDEIIDKFEKVAPMLAREYGAVPVVGVGHSCGALLHVLITSLFPDTPRAANALLSYNNKGVGEAVPFFEELIVPLFSDGERNGSRLMKAMITVAREKYNGRVPSDEALFNLIKELPSPIPGQSINTLLGGLGGIGGGSGEKNGSSLLSPSLVSIPKPLRESLTNFLTEPTFDALTNAGVTPLLMQSLDITQQIPKLIDEVEMGARDFVPTPDAMSSAARRAYRCRRTLLMQFENDNLDESEQLESYLREAESVMKMKRPMITIDLQRKVLDGNHATPLLGPLGGEDDALRDVLGTLSGVLPGIVGGGGGGEEDVQDDGEAGSINNSNSLIPVENVVDELVAWLDEGSL